MSGRNRRPFKSLESGDGQFWVITISILLLGFLFVFSYMFAVQTQRCVSLADYWLESYPGLYRLFAWAFGLLFVWNLLLYSVSDARAGKRELAHFLANGAAILVIGYVLLRLYQFVLEYEVLYEYADADWNTTATYEPCKNAKPFLGAWAIKALNPSAEEAFPYRELHLHRRLEFELHADGTVHTGRWQPEFSGKAITLDYEGTGKLQFFEILEFNKHRMLLQQMNDHIDSAEVRQPLKLELRRLSESAGR